MLDSIGAVLTTQCGVKRGDRVVVGVSGGPDSVALLLSLCQLRPSLGIDLSIAHLDHTLRETSGDDAEFVVRLGSDLGVPAFVDQVNVRALAVERRRGIEEAGRFARYRFFERVVCDTGSVGVALGHTADDQAESILLHIVRGAGLAGASGMRYLQPLSIDGGIPLHVMRPMLDLPRTWSADFCSNNGIEPRIDRSNASMDFVRNRIRHELLPAMRGINPRATEALIGLGNAASIDHDYINVSADLLLSDVLVLSDGLSTIDTIRFIELHAALRRRAIIRAYAAIASGESTLEQGHLRAVDALLAARKAGKSLDLPGGVRVDIAYGVARFRRTESRGFDSTGLLPLAVPGTTTVGRSGQSILAQPIEGACALSDSREHVHIDLDASGSLAVRRRRPGDRIQPFGASGHRKLQDLLVDARVPRFDRDDVPVVVRAADPADIVWVAGVRLDNRYRVTDDTRSIICLHLEKAEGDTAHRLASDTTAEVWPLSSKLSADVERVLISEKELQARIAELGRQITADYAGKELLLIGVLKGAVMFMVDLARSIDLPVAIDFMATSSYGASTQSSGVVRILKDLDRSVEGKHLLIVEDIVDTGLTLKYLVDLLKERRPAQIDVCALLNKQARRKTEIELTYVGFDIPDEFVVGYGLDYAEVYRNLPYIGVLRPSKYQS